MALASAAYAQTSPAQMGITRSAVPEVLQVLDHTGAWVKIGEVQNGGFLLPVAQGGTGTATPGLLGSGGVRIFGAWPNQTVDGVDIAVGNTPGRVLATQSTVGMAPSIGNVIDNVPMIPALMNASMPAAGSAGGGGAMITFPSQAGQQWYPYYFSDSLGISRGGVVNCGGYSGPAALSGAVLVFAPGVDGVRQEDGNTSADGGNGLAGSFENCAVVSLGGRTRTAAWNAGDHSITGVVMAGIGPVPAPTWNPGDGFVLWDFNNSAFSISAGSVSGNQLTVTTLASGAITIGSSLCDGSPACTASNNMLPNTYITAQSSGTPGGAGVYTLNQSQPATDVATTFNGRNLWWAPAVPAGAYIDSASGSTLNIHSGFEPTHTSASFGGVIWPLPAIQAYTITAMSGSRTFTVTAGPSANPTRKLWPGDFVWSQPFAPGCVVYSATGAGGAQVITLSNTTMVPATSSVCNASASGSFQLWKLPSGYRMTPQAQLRNDYFQNFPIGVNVLSAGSSTPPANATNQYVERTGVFNSIVGFVSGGGNTGASVFVGNEGAQNSFADFVEGGTVGSGHFGDNSNSAEGGTAPVAIVSNCSNTNMSVWVGNYLGSPQPYNAQCMPSNGMIFAATAPIYAGGASMVVAPNATSPTDAVRLDTTGIHNAATFGFNWKSGAPAAYFNSYVNALYPFALSKDGTMTKALGFNYNSTIDAWQTNTGNVTAVSSSGDYWIGNAYTGYTGVTANIPYHGFYQGFLLGGPALSTGGERQVYAGTSKNTSVNNKRGNVEFNTAPSPGGSAGWIDTVDGANMTPFGPVANDANGTDYTISTILRTGTSGNKDMTGRIALSGGAASFTFAATNAGAPNCFCFDVTTPANVCTATESATSVSFAGTGTDTIKWHCDGRN